MFGVTVTMTVTVTVTVTIAEYWIFFLLFKRATIRNTPRHLRSLAKVEKSRGGGDVWLVSA